MISRAVLAAVIGGIFLVSVSSAYSATLNFGQNAKPLSLDQDISIRRVSISVHGFYVGGFADYCLEFKREKAPLYSPTVGRGGYIEPMCFNTVRQRSTKGTLATIWDWAMSKTFSEDGPVFVPAGDWVQSVDLSKTPIYVPAGTLLNCGSLGALSSVSPSGSLVGTCTVEYEPHQQLEPRFRFLRLPYYDQFFQHGKPLVTSYLKSFEGRPLHISSAVVYIGNNHHGSHMEACLTKEQGGETIDQLCFPPADQDSPGQVPINWTIHENERVALDCHYPPDDQTSSGDCAAYLVVRLPDDLELSPENAFRDYGEIPRDYVATWCEQTALIITEESMHDPKLCLGKEECSFDEKITNCLYAFEHTTFPQASCMGGKSCYTSTYVPPS